jgi:hypothetical protein
MCGIKNARLSFTTPTTSKMETTRPMAKKMMDEINVTLVAVILS